MQRQNVPLSVVFAALSACAAEPELLNSERIEERFGSYGIEVLPGDARFRRSSLYSLEHGIRTCRTFAIVHFVDHLDSAVSAEHARILSGDSIGAVFKLNGWRIEKSTQYIGEVSLTGDDDPIARLMRLDGPAVAAVHAYTLSVAKDERSVDYATIIEVHHPDYLSQPDLREIFTEAPNAELESRQVEALIRTQRDAA